MGTTLRFEGRNEITKMSKVLQLYRQLHRTTRYVFKGDIASINTVSIKIREEFEKNRDVKSDTAVEELIKYGLEAEEILRKFVLQIEQVDDTTYRANIRKDMHFNDNVMYRDDITPQEYKAKNRELSKEVKKCYEIRKEALKENPELS